MAKAMQANFTGTTKEIIMRYLRFKRDSGVQTFALECEYPAGTYHIHLYDLRELIAWLGTMDNAELKELFREKDGLRLRPLTTGAQGSRVRNLLMYQMVHEKAFACIYTQDGRISATEVEEITAEIADGKLNTGRKGHRYDVSSAEWGKIECKGMGGMFAQGDERVTD